MGTTNAKQLIFANGIWKSGNNLLIKLLELAGHHYSDFGLAASTINGPHYWTRKLIRGVKFERYPVSIGLDIPVCVSGKWLSRKINSLNGDFFTGHAAYSERLLNLLESANVKTIQIIRDPRDIVVSYAQWVLTRPDYYTFQHFSQFGPEECHQQLITGVETKQLKLDSLATVLDRSYGWLTNPNICVIRFEDLIGKQGGGDEESQNRAIKSILEHLGQNKPSDQTIDAIQSQLFGGTKTFNKGQISQWKEKFSNETEALFHSVIGERLGLWGYDE